MPSFRGNILRGDDFCFRSEGYAGDVWLGAAEDAVAFLEVVKYIYNKADSTKTLAKGGSRGATVALIIGGLTDKLDYIIATSTHTNFLDKYVVEYERVGGSYSRAFYTPKANPYEIRKRIIVEHTHDLWVGDFEEGPYVMVNEEVVPTYLCAFIDHHSRYVVDARYYLRQNLDILVDSLARGLSIHGTPITLYLDNAKVYHSTALKAACYRLKIRLKHRPPGEPETGVAGTDAAETSAGDEPTVSEHPAPAPGTV